MNVPVKVLLLEDCERDGMLIAAELENGGYSPAIERVWSAETMDAALQSARWDLIISDFNMPSFNAFEGLALLKKRGYDIPFIIVSGTVGEERAVAAMKAGAADYVPKGSLGRLIPAINRELAEFQERELRRNTQRALATAEGNFRTLVENSIAGIYVIQDERLAYVNPRVSEILGYSIPELLSRPLVDFVCPEDRATVESNIRKRIDGGVKSINYTLRMIAKDGTLVYIEAHGARTDYNDRPAILGILTDATQRRRAQERFTTIFRSSPVGIALSTLSENRVIEANESILEILGYSREEFVGRTITELGLWADANERLNLIESLVASGSISNIECNFRRKSGEKGVGLASFELIEEQGEKCVLVFFHDITEKKSLESQVMRNQRMESIGSLAGGIAHDLNNALAPILMTAELLRMTYDQPEAHRMLDVLKSSAQRGAEMVKQVLTFARGIEGKHAVVQIRHVMTDIISMAKQTFPKTIEIKQSISKDLWPVNGDSTQLHQVLLNLCVNARDAMPHGGVLTLSASNVFLDEKALQIFLEAKEGPYTTISVVDTGTGIPDHIRERIFDPFFTTKEVGKGTGLGLSTVRSIIKTHNGFLSLESKEGKGTQFTIYLPAEVSGKNELAESTRPIVPAGNGECILVVDDEALIRDIARQVLEAFGYEVLIAQNGAEAVAICAQNNGKIRLLLTDLRMPVMNGAATIEAIRLIAPEIKVIVATAETISDEAKLFMPSSAQAVLQKPFTPDKLLRAIHEVLHGKGPEI
ncbi:MAG: hybrid sensor histidine kinase/response regulator [Verrucomicrobiales bacterium]|jgi:PAS domain S-box-containing protein|nr:hybrid sensor histidine kinase/response regulator [Verrucomicrobiales bacterium]